MKKTVFNDFRYVSVASSMKGFKEVLVSFTANGKDMHQVIFLEEMKGASNATYLKAAKQEIERQIKNNELMKKSKRTINRTKKPLVIALTAAIAVGAVIGTYFLTRYYNGGDTPAPVATGYTVLLLAGDGYFAESGDSFLVLENVKEGTKLADIKGYETPVKDKYTFDHWEWGESNKVYQDTLVKQNLYLTARYVSAADVEREKVKEEINNEAEELIKNDPEISGDANKQKGVAEVSSYVSGELTEQAKNIVEPEQVEAIHDLTDNVFNIIKKCEGTEQEIKDQIASVVDIFKQTLDEGLSDELNAQQSAAVLNLSSSFFIEKVNDLYNYSAIDRFFVMLRDYIKELQTPEDANTLEVIRSIAAGVMKSAVLIDKTDEITIGLFGKHIRDKVNDIVEKKYQKDAVKDLGSLLGKFFLAISKTGGNEDNINLLDEYYKTVEGYFYNSIFDLDNNPESTYLYEFGLDGMETLYNLDAGTDDILHFDVVKKGLFDLFEKFKMYFSDIVAKGGNKLANCKKLMKDAIKASAHITDSNTFNALLSGIIQGSFLPSFPEEYWDTVLKTSETIANFYRPKEAQIIGISIIDTLNAWTDETNYLRGATEPKAIQNIKTLYSGIIESTGYSSLYAVDRLQKQKFPSLHTHLEAIINAKFDSSYALDISVVAGSYVAASMYLGKRMLINYDTNISPLEKSYSANVRNYVDALKKIDPSGTLGPKYFTVLSNAMKYYYCYQDSETACQKLNAIYSLLGDMTKTKLPIANNYLDLWCAYFAKEELFLNYPKLDNLVIEAQRTLKRVTYMEDNVRNTVCSIEYAMNDKFPQIYAILEDTFYKKITKNILPGEVGVLLNQAVEKINEILAE